MDDDGGSSVRVAVRIRPQLPREIIDACKICTFKTPGEPQAWIGSNKAFTYDYVYDTAASQEEVYDDTVKQLIEVRHHLVHLGCVLFDNAWNIILVHENLSTN